ncbi:unnamed protein product [Calicophoron daubneyi]|uniref:Saposin B-type domain-containing protein n=1 Tax=Calicophoron daubneyi TaxID=300641 RepID=A0AAV2SZ67_CALDB
MRLLVLFALIGLSVAAPVYEVPENLAILCKFCKASFNAFVSLIKSHAPQEVFSQYVNRVCSFLTKTYQVQCRKNFYNMQKYLEEHIGETDPGKACKAIGAC